MTELQSTKCTVGTQLLLNFLGYKNATDQYIYIAQKKDGDRSKDKGRRVCLGGKIYSTPCRASCFASVDLKEKVEIILFFNIVGAE